jgi:hypothetical protein
MRARRDLAFHVLNPALEEGRNRHASGIDASAVLRLGEQPGTLDLGLALGARKGMPAALAFAGLRIAHVDDDGPMTGRPFANVAFHFSSPLSVFFDSLANAASASCATFCWALRTLA